MAKHTILIARFPYGGSERSTTTSWLVETVRKMKADPRIGEVLHVELNDTPITMTRNAACRIAQEKKADYILMVDNDMAPDLAYPGAKPFWESSFDFALKFGSPCAIAAPYCGPPPCENIYVFRWTNMETDTPNHSFKLDQFTREDAACRSGIEEVAALPTGLFLLDVRALDFAPVPWFEYEYTDKYQTAKATTEDVFFTRNLSLAGIPVFCNWDAWAGHWKNKCVGKPVLLTKDFISESLRDTLKSNRSSDERVLYVRGEETDATKLSLPARRGVRANSEGVRSDWDSPVSNYRYGLATPPKDIRCKRD